MKRETNTYFYTNKIISEKQLIIGDSYIITPNPDIPLIMNLKSGFGVPSTSTLQDGNVPMMVYDNNNETLSVYTPTNGWVSVEGGSNPANPPYVFEKKGNGFIALDKSANAVGDYSIEMQPHRDTPDRSGLGDYDIIIGRNNKSISDYTIIIGRNNFSDDGVNNIIIGDTNQLSGEEIVSIGNNNLSNSIQSVLIGDNIHNNGNSAVLIGDNIINDDDSVLIMKPSNSSEFKLDSNKHPIFQNMPYIECENVSLPDNTFTIDVLETEGIFRVIVNNEGTTTCKGFSLSGDNFQGELFAKLYNDNFPISGNGFSFDGIDTYSVEFTGAFYESSIPSSPYWSNTSSSYYPQFIYTTPTPTTSLKGYSLLGDVGTAIIFVGNSYRICVYTDISYEEGGGRQIFENKLFVEKNPTFFDNSDEFTGNDRYIYDDRIDTNVLASEVFDGKCHAFKIVKDHDTLSFYKDESILFSITDAELFSNDRDEIYLASDMCVGAHGNTSSTTLFDLYSALLYIDGNLYSKWEIPDQNSKFYTVGRIEDVLNNNDILAIKTGIDTKDETDIHISKSHKCLEINDDLDILTIKYPAPPFTDSLKDDYGHYRGLQNFIRFEAFLSSENLNNTGEVVFIESGPIDQNDPNSILRISYDLDTNSLHTKYGEHSFSQSYQGDTLNIQKEELFNDEFKTIAIQNTITNGVIDSAITIGLFDTFMCATYYDTGISTLTLPTTATLFSSKNDNSKKIISKIRRILTFDVDNTYEITEIHEFDLDLDLSYSNNKLISYRFSNTGNTTELQLESNSMLVEYLMDCGRE